jgi:hypothetical protein
MRFHDLAVTRRELMGGFDIDIYEGLTEGEIATATRSFQRRHVYEHNGGEVDQKYLRDSGDTSVRLKQTIRETQVGVHEFATIVLRMARNLHRLPRHLRAGQDSHRSIRRGEEAYGHLPTARRGTIPST